MSYLTEVLADAPRHYWRCADPGGRMLFDIGSTRQALAISNWNMNLPYLGPNSDGGALFSSDNGGAEAQPGIAESLPQTAECWFWMLNGAAHRAYLMNIADTSGNDLVSLTLDATNHPQVWGTTSNVLSTTPLPSQTWHHFVGVSTASGLSLYVDGVLIGSTGSGASTKTVAIGLGASVSAGGQYIIGCLSECAVYRSALSAARIAAHFAAADQIGQTPVYAANGSFSLSTGAGSFDTTDLALILQSVRKTF